MNLLTDLLNNSINRVFASEQPCSEKLDSLLPVCGREAGPQARQGSLRSSYTRNTHQWTQHMPLRSWSIDQLSITPWLTSSVNLENLIEFWIRYLKFRRYYQFNLTRFSASFQSIWFIYISLLTDFFVGYFGEQSIERDFFRDSFFLSRTRIFLRTWIATLIRNLPERYKSLF